jgi:cobalt-zinc-cadmium resistance protein CzcA
VVIGGIVSSTILTLLVLPALYVLFRRETRPADALAPPAGEAAAAPHP